jgi:hypothetical protein
MKCNARCAHPGCYVLIGYDTKDYERPRYCDRHIEEVIQRLSRTDRCTKEQIYQEVLIRLHRLDRDVRQTKLPGSDDTTEQDTTIGGRR